MRRCATTQQLSTGTPARQDVAKACYHKRWNYSKTPLVLLYMVLKSPTLVEPSALIGRFVKQHIQLTFLLPVTCIQRTVKKGVVLVYTKTVI